MTKNIQFTSPVKFTRIKSPLQTVIILLQSFSYSVAKNRLIPVKLSGKKKVTKISTLTKKL